MIFSPSYPSCVSLPINNQELLITGQAESHPQARDTPPKQTPASSGNVAPRQHRKLDKTGPRYFAAAFVIQTFPQRDEGPERQAAFTTVLSPSQTVAPSLTPSSLPLQ